MKLINLLSIITAVLLFSIVTYAQNAYAPWTDLKPDLPDGVAINYENMKLNTPDKNMVELPAYPGAKIIATSDASESVDESQKPRLATVTLVSSDPAEKIIGFYKDLITEYKGWHWDAKMKIFYKNDLNEALNRHDSYIQVTSIQSEEPDLKYVTSDVLENAASKIVVCYDPNTVNEN